MAILSRIESELASREQSSATQESFLRRIVCNRSFVVNIHYLFQPGPLVYISLDDPDGGAPFTHVFGVELNENGFDTNRTNSSEQRQKKAAIETDRLL